MGVGGALRLGVRIYDQVETDWVSEVGGERRYETWVLVLTATQSVD